jgi:hypothetical protein
VNEIVLPDVLGSTQQTVSAVQAVLPELSTAFNYMGVLQGKTMSQLGACAKFYVENVPNFTTFGIPRHLLTSMAAGPDDHYRAQIAKLIRNQFGDDYQIHLLGTNPKYIAELVYWNVTFEKNKVRGVDTSAPYNYTFANEMIRPGVERERPDNYFDLAADVFPEPLLSYNIQRARKWSE